MPEEDLNLDPQEEEVIEDTEVDLDPDTRFPDVPDTPTITKDEPEEEDDELDPAVAKIINKRLAEQEARLAKQFGAHSQVTQEVKDQVDVDSFVRDNPDYGKYRTSMLKYLKHPAYKNIPVSSIAAIVSAKDQQAIGARKERETQRQVASTATPGTSARPVEQGAKNWLNVSKEDFQAKMNEVLGRGA